jgi:hypothetical protein
MKPKLLILIWGMAACATAPQTPAQVDPPFPRPGPVGAVAHTYPVETGWFNGQAVEYYNLGANTPLNPADPTRVLVEPVWAFVVGQNSDGTPMFLDGQFNLFDVTLGDPDYTDLWQPHFVTPPADYSPGSITAAEQLQTSGFPIAKQPMFVNCPIVPPESTLSDSDLPLKTAWVRGEKVFYFDFGPTEATPGKMYVFITGVDSSNNPILVPGQHFIFDSARGESGYSDFWIVQWVLVDSAYQPDSVRAVADIPGEIKPSTLVVNYPHK